MSAVAVTKHLEAVFDFKMTIFLTTKSYIFNQGPTYQRS